MHKHFAVLLWEVTQKHLLWPTKTPACDFHELLVQMLLRLSGHFHPVSLFSIYHNRLTPPIWSPFGSSDSTSTFTKPCSSSSGLLFLPPEGRFCLACCPGCWEPSPSSLLSRCLHTSPRTYEILWTLSVWWKAEGSNSLVRTWWSYQESKTWCSYQESYLVPGVLIWMQTLITFLHVTIKLYCPLVTLESLSSCITRRKHYQRRQWNILPSIRGQNQQFPFSLP